VVKSHWLRLEGSDILLHDNASNVAWFMNGCSILQSAGIRQRQRRRLGYPGLNAD